MIFDPEYAYHLYLVKGVYRSAMIEWAVSVLASGGSGQATVLLAGADYEVDRVVVDLFLRAAPEQGVSLPQGDDVAEWHERCLCHAILERRVSPGEGLGHLYNLWVQSGYSKFVRWGQLSEAIELLQDPGFGLEPFEGMTLDTIDQTIVGEARRVYETKRPA